MFTLRALQTTTRHSRALFQQPCYSQSRSSISSTHRQFIKLFSTSSDGTIETGQVKFYEVPRAYGFIISDNDQKEIFVHRTDIAGAPKDDNMNPVLKKGERVQYRRFLKEGSENLYKAEEVVFENGDKIPVYREEHIASLIKATKLRLGEKVYQILTEGGDEEAMAQNIAAAYTEARDKIIQVEQKSKRSGILV